MVLAMCSGVCVYVCNIYMMFVLHVQVCTWACVHMCTCIYAVAHSCFSNSACIIQIGIRKAEAKRNEGPQIPTKNQRDKVLADLK